MKIWVKTKEFIEGKFLVVRRDSSVPHWPHFVLGARDRAAPGALRVYACIARAKGYEEEYCQSILELADDFDRYREQEGEGDPEASPHRKDDPSVIQAMRGDPATIYICPDTKNYPKASA